MTKFFLVFLGFTFYSCSSVQQSHRPLLEQILKFRPGYKTLTHKICAESPWVGGCRRWDVREYDLADAKVRETLISLQFRCVIAGFRYKIDPDKPRFVRYRRIGGGLFGGKEQVVKENPVDFFETQFLLDAGTRCYSEKFYPEGLTQ